MSASPPDVPAPATPARTRLSIVAVHGNGGGASRYRRVHDHVPSDVEFRAVTLPGFSTEPADPALSSLGDYADHLASMFADLECPVVLGHGIGGSIALDLAHRRPDLLGGLILHAPVGAGLDTRWFPRLMGCALVRDAIRWGISSRALRPLWRRLFFPHGAPNEVLDEFFDEYRHAEAFGQMFDLIDRQWFDSVEPVTDLPVILLWGADDRVLASGQAEEIRGKVPTAEVVIRDGWDHFPMIEQPEEYAREIVAMADRLRSG